MKALNCYVTVRRVTNKRRVTTVVRDHDHPNTDPSRRRFARLASHGVKLSRRSRSTRIFRSQKELLLVKVLPLRLGGQLRYLQFLLFVATYNLQVGSACLNPNLQATVPFVTYVTYVTLRTKSTVRSITVTNKTVTYL